MKEKYEKPGVELDNFEIQDILTASDSGSDPPWGGEIVIDPEFPVLGI